MRSFWLLAVLAILIAGVLLFRTDPCTGPFPVRDSSELVAAEAADLSNRVRAVYREDARAKTRQPLSKPLSVAIDGVRATITVQGPMYAGDLQYAQAWHEVFHAKHGGPNHCVRLKILWKTGSLDQEFPPPES